MSFQSVCAGSGSAPSGIATAVPPRVAVVVNGAAVDKDEGGVPAAAKSKGAGASVPMKLDDGFLPTDVCKKKKERKDTIKVRQKRAVSKKTGTQKKSLTSSLCLQHKRKDSGSRCGT